MVWLPLVRIVTAVPNYFEEAGEIVAVIVLVLAIFVVVAAAAAAVAAAAVVAAAFSMQTLLDWHPAVLDATLLAV